jgi:hypothetical protein
VRGTEVFHRPLAGPLGGGDVVVVVGRSIRGGAYSSCRACTTNLLTLSKRIHSLWLGWYSTPPPGHSTRCRPCCGRTRRFCAKPSSAGTQRWPGRCWSERPTAHQDAVVRRPRPPTDPDHARHWPRTPDHQIEALIDHMGPRKAQSGHRPAVRSRSFVRQPPLPRHEPFRRRPEVVSESNVSRPMDSQDSATVVALGHLLRYAGVRRPVQAREVSA